MIRKAVFLYPDEEEALREKSFRERRAQSEIIREALRSYLGLKD